MNHSAHLGFYLGLREHTTAKYSEVLTDKESSSELPVRTAHYREIMWRILKGLAEYHREWDQLGSNRELLAEGKSEG